MVRDTDELAGRLIGDVTRGVSLIVEAGLLVGDTGLPPILLPV